MSEGHQEQALTYKTDEGLTFLTEEGEKAISGWVTDVEGDVYAFTADANSETVAAAMARLSRNVNGIREIIASEFLNKGTKDEQLLGRVISQFGDDSVMQLYPMQIVFEKISNIATKEVERGRLSAYLEQSTRYLRFDQKDEDGHYPFYSPEEFDPETAAIYETSQTEIFDIYSDLYNKLKKYIGDKSSTPENERDAAWRTSVHAQACDGVRALLPASTKATVAVVGSAQAIQNMIFNLEAHNLPEMKRLGRKALAASRLVAPVFFERTDMPTRGKLISDHREATREDTRALAKELLGTIETKEAGLQTNLLRVDGTEDDLIVKILMDTTSYSNREIADEVAHFTPDQKRKVIQTYVGDRYNRRAKAGRAFESIHYFFEITSDYGAFRDIQRSRLVDGLEWQPLQTELGHITPPAIIEAGLTEEYDRAFDISKDLYKELQDRGYADQSQYATLFGHVMRYSFLANARSMMHTAELRTTPQGHPSYRKVYKEIHELIAGVHPTVAESMNFVSQAEDEELARLGAEKYNQEKNKLAE